MRPVAPLGCAAACALLLAACGDTPVARSSAPALPITGPVGTPVPTTTPNPHPTVITFVSAPVHAGGRASLRASTAPHAACTASLSVNGRPARASGLGARESDSEGRVAWTWTVPSRTPKGEWPLQVDCTPGGQAVTLLLVQ